MTLTHALRDPQPSFRNRRQRGKKRPPLFKALNQPNTDKRDFLIGSVAAVGGIVVISGLGVVVTQALLPPGAVLKTLELAQTSPLAPLIYGVVAITLPTVFVSQTLMTLAAGALFGVATGTVLSIAAQTLSSMIAYGIGGQLTKRTQIGGTLIARIEPYIGRLRQNAFEGMLIMRLLYLPQEIVSYASGMLNVGWKPLILGTALGSLPSTFFLVQVGAGFSSGIFGTATYFNPALLLISGGVFASSVLLARYMREEDHDEDIIEGEIIDEVLLVSN